MSQRPKAYELSFPGKETRLSSGALGIVVISEMEREALNEGWKLPIGKNATVVNQFASYDVDRRSPTWIKRIDGLTVNVWRSRWTQRGTGEDGFRSRMIVFLVQSGEVQIAVGHFDEWKIDPCTSEPYPDLDLFLDIADNRDGAGYELAMAILREWTEDNRGMAGPFDYGSLIHFSRMIIEARTASESVSVWDLISALIAREFGPRSLASIIFVKPFPLEYEGAGEDHTSAFHRRNDAMLRLYRRRLRIKPLGGSKDWFWIDLERGCRPPTAPG
jgi:hypothetical protein